VLSVGSAYNGSTMKAKKTKRAASKASACPRKPEEGSQDTSITPTVNLLEVMDALPFYAMLVDAEHHILTANSAIRKHLGVSPEDIVGKYCPKIIHDLDGPFPGCPLEEAVDKKQGGRARTPGREVRSLGSVSHLPHQRSNV